MRKYLKTICCITCTLLASVAVADPFSWEHADIRIDSVTFADGSEIHYRLGHIQSGNYVEMSIVIDYPPLGLSDTDLVMLHAMTLNIPKVRAWQDLLVVEDTGVLWGEYQPTTHFRCWQPDQMFAEIDCPAGLSL